MWLFLWLFVFNLPSQPPLFKSPAYINHYAGEAVHQMAIYRIPASVILAQAIFESNCGTSDLAAKSNNHFGIKCHTGWGGDTIVKTDDALDECFRKYASVEESYTDHSRFLKTRSRYAKLFEYSILDYKNWCRGLKASGYATNARYAEDLIRIIEENKLYEIDGAEKLSGGTLLLNKQPKHLRKTNGLYFNAAILAKSGVLFMDERDIHVRSLELMLEQEEEDLAGNP